jgi:dihydroorotate dehydrogenase
MYFFLKKILFQLDPEISHHIALRSLQLANYLGLMPLLFPSSVNNPMTACTLMGLNFSNHIGLAAGLDKNGDYIDALAALGFGFIEIGTITPKPQSGNPKPRLFRLTKEQAIINRMGFNNKGIEYVLRRLEKTKYRGILGINIGKNKDTPLENAADDYLKGFRAFWKYASYITINISSPNTAGLRDLQHSAALTNLLCVLKQEQHSIYLNEKKYVPLVVKISPDLSEQELQDIAAVLLKEKIDGVIATNTTVKRDGIETSIYAKESGGLSGKPLNEKSTAIVTQLHTLLQDNIPIIAVGGIMDANSAQEKMAAGAALLQIYSGFIYSGPGLVTTLLRDAKTR